MSFPLSSAWPMKNDRKLATSMVQKTAPAKTTSFARSKVGWCLMRIVVRTAQAMPSAVLLRVESTCCW